MGVSPFFVERGGGGGGGREGTGVMGVILPTKNGLSPVQPVPLTQIHQI